MICAGGSEDTIYGKGGADVIYAGGGNDVIYPGAGRDQVQAGPGGDLIYSLDSRRDMINGGSGLDRARADTLDRTTGVERFFPRHQGPDPILLAAGDIASV
jgi:Ca2+-binding RTX toxin-like protein